MCHNLWVKKLRFFMNFDQKIAEYEEDDESKFVIFTNKPGLQDFSDVIAKHSRKCDKRITPCFNGFKVCWHQSNFLTFLDSFSDIFVLTKQILGSECNGEDCMPVWLHDHL